jgi:tetratricopeptide (TPR) repeat protein
MAGGTSALRGGASIDAWLLRAVLVLVIAVLAVVAWAVWYLPTQTVAPRTALERQLAKLESLSRTQPANSTVWADWATLLVQSGDLSKAADVIARGSVATTDTMPVKVAEARLVAAQGNNSGAIALLDTTIATLLEQEDVRKKAMADKGAVISLQTLTAPALIEAQVLRGELLDLTGRTADAIAAYTFALTRDPQMADVLVARADLYARSGKAAEAEADYRKALTMIPDDQAALDGLKTLGRPVTQ